MATMAMEEKNYKGLLIEWCLKNKRSPPRFEMPEQTGPPHDRVFFFQVFIDDTLFGEAKDKKKKLAENTASKIALQKLKNEDIKYQPDYVALLHQFSQKRNQHFTFVPVSRQGPDHNLEFTLRVNFENIDYPLSSAKRSKKQAQKEAAYLALQELRRSFPNEIPELPEVFIDEPGSQNSSLSGSAGGDTSGNRSLSENGFSDTASATSEDPVALLYLFCQKQSWTLDFMDVGQTGPPHNRQFSCKAIVGSTSYPESNMRKTKKLAKKEAAYLALKKLKSEFPHDIPDLKVFIEDSETGQSSASSVNNLLDEFDSITKLGEGGFGQVFKARKILDNKFYAVKIVEYREEKVRQEATVLANLDYHKNIVRYYNTRLGLHTFSDSSKSSSSSSDFSKPVRCIYIQMELCENGSLKNWIEKRNLHSEVNKSKSLEIFRQIIEGVRYIHAQKLIHRDLKPENIFFTKDMTVKIGDFGLVTQMTGEEKSKAIERTRGTGTPSYMAPEQNNNKYENEVDIYALGLILFELLWIFQSGHERAKVLTNVRKGEFPSGFEQRHPLEKHEISKMLSHDPKKRPLAENLSVSFQKGKALDSQTR